MIRKAKASEIVQLISITKSCAAHMIANDIYQWNESYPNITAFEQDFNRGELYVLYTPQNTLVGCITISSEKDQSSMMPFLGSLKIQNTIISIDWQSLRHFKNKATQEPSWILPNLLQNQTRGYL